MRLCAVLSVMLTAAKLAKLLVNRPVFKDPITDQGQRLMLRGCECAKFWKDPTSLLLPRHHSYWLGGVHVVASRKARSQSRAG